MGKDENVTRVDLRIPNEIYETIERIAVITNQPFTPKSKNSSNPKPIVTPVILKGLELVLTRLKDDLVSELSEGRITDTQIIKDNLEDRIFKRLEKKLVALFEANLGKLTADTITPESKDNLEIIEDLPEDNKESAGAQRAVGINTNLENTSEDTEALTPEILIENEVTERVSSGNDNNESEYVKNLNAIEVNSEVVNEDVSALEIGISSGKLAERFKSNKNKGQGASKTTINTNKTKLSKEDFIKWTQEQDPEGKAWYYNETDSKFYPL
jgi:hypothetical protein